MNSLCIDILSMGIKGDNILPKRYTMVLKGSSKPVEVYDTTVSLKYLTLILVKKGVGIRKISAAQYELLCLEK